MSIWNSEGRKSALLFQPSKWIPLYEEFITENASSVGQVESALRSLTYIIPGLVDVMFLRLSVWKTDSCFVQDDTETQKYLQNAVWFEI